MVSEPHIVSRTVIWVLAILGMLLPGGNIQAAGATDSSTYEVAPYGYDTANDVAANALVLYRAAVGGNVVLTRSAAVAPEGAYDLSAFFVAPQSVVDDVGLSSRGLTPAPGTRVRPTSIPDEWRVAPTRGEGGTWYYDPTNKGYSVRVMQGSPNSPHPNSQAPYVRWQFNGQPLDVNGNVLPTKFSPDAHIPLNDFEFLPEVFGL